MNNDPADRRARKRRDAGLSRELAVSRAALPFPGRGGTCGYPEWLRRMVLGGHADVGSDRSHRRWWYRVVPYRMTGNDQSTSLENMDLILLAVFYVIWPTGSMDECCAFIYNNGGDVYSRSDISLRLKKLKLTRKKASTEAYQAHTPVNRLRCELFFSMPPPIGIVQVPRRKFIDVDEFGIALEKCNNKHGFALKCYRIRKTGHYTRNTKLTVLFAVEAGDRRLPNNIRGSLTNPRRWVRVLMQQGTTALVFASFIDHICRDIETNGIPQNQLNTDSQRIFLWDNLNSHFAPIVNQTIMARNGNTIFSSIPRPPYQPKFGPIEYKILDCVTAAMKRITSNSTTVDLEQALLRAASEIGPFDSTFQHCGYTTI